MIRRSAGWGFLCFHSMLLTLFHYSAPYCYYSKRILVLTTQRPRLTVTVSKRPSEPSMFPPREWTPSFWETKNMPRNTMEVRDSIMTSKKAIGCCFCKHDFFQFPYNLPSRWSCKSWMYSDFSISPTAFCWRPALRIAALSSLTLISLGSGSLILQ